MFTVTSLFCDHYCMCVYVYNVVCHDCKTDELNILCSFGMVCVYPITFSSCVCMFLKHSVIIYSEFLALDI